MTCKLEEVLTPEEMKRLYVHNLDQSTELKNLTWDNLRILSFVLDEDVFRIDNISAHSIVVLTDRAIEAKIQIYE